MLTKLKHPGTVAMRSAWADSKFYYLLFDYALNGDLHTFLKQNSKLIFFTAHPALEILSINLARYFSA